ncbi:hypothetical protein CBF23_007740 [Marinomonas agarivorans]|nr:hypothetical protein CBF23_007740 [Marinomonas agarivorans]
MTSLPIFLTCVANSIDEPDFPLLLTWSTPEAQIKEVLVIPDDNWLESAQIESNHLAIDEGQLYEFGYEASDILAEWNNELDTDQVLALDVESVSKMVERIYDVKGLYPNFEIVSVWQWFAEQDIDLAHEIGLRHNEYAIDTLPPDELIAALLTIAYDHGLIDMPESLTE